VSACLSIRPPVLTFELPDRFLGEMLRTLYRQTVHTSYFSFSTTCKSNMIHIQLVRRKWHQRYIILSRVRGSVTNNNGFWIGWLDLLPLQLQLQQIITVHNHWLRFAPFLTGLQVSSPLLWLRSDLRISHFFSFRCPLVNTPQLNTQLLLRMN
jgi:hypothetical protein